MQNIFYAIAMQTVVQGHILSSADMPIIMNIIISTDEYICVKLVDN